MKMVQYSTTMSSRWEQRGRACLSPSTNKARLNFRPEQHKKPPSAHHQTVVRTVHCFAGCRRLQGADALTRTVALHTTASHTTSVTTPKPPTRSCRSGIHTLIDPIVVLIKKCVSKMMVHSFHSYANKCSFKSNLTKQRKGAKRALAEANVQC